MARSSAELRFKVVKTVDVCPMFSQVNGGEPQVYRSGGGAIMMPPETLAESPMKELHLQDGLVGNDLRLRARHFRRRFPL